MKAKKEAAKAEKQMNRVKHDIATQNGETSGETSGETDGETSGERGREKVPLVAGAKVQGGVEFESAEEAAERRECESLMEYADELHRARKERE